MNFNIDKLNKLSIELKVCNRLMELDHIDADTKEFVQDAIYEALEALALLSKQYDKKRLAA